VVALLCASHLPLDGVDQATHIVVAKENSGLVGTAALEMYPDGRCFDP
jgi:hypothetical protein